jgi:hypothetical protein
MWSNAVTAKPQQTIIDPTRTLLALWLEVVSDSFEPKSSSKCCLDFSLVFLGFVLFCLVLFHLFLGFSHLCRLIIRTDHACLKVTHLLPCPSSAHTLLATVATLPQCTRSFAGSIAHLAFYRGLPTPCRVFGGCKQAGPFSGLSVLQARAMMRDHALEHGFGRPEKVTKMRDWLVSRQRCVCRWFARLCGSIGQVSSILPPPRFTRARLHRLLLGKPPFFG